MKPDNVQDRARRIVNKSGLRWTHLATLVGIRRARLSEWKNGKIELTREELQLVVGAVERCLPEVSEGSQLEGGGSLVARGGAIRRKRLQFGISQGELGKKAGIAQYQVSMIETGASETVTAAQTFRLEKALEALCTTKAKAVEKVLEEYSKGVDEFLVEHPDFYEVVGEQGSELSPPQDPEERRRWVRRRSLELAKYAANQPSTRAMLEVGKQLASQERQIAALEQQVAALRDQNTSLREWLDQEQRAALEHARAKELEEKVLKSEVKG